MNLILKKIMKQNKWNEKKYYYLLKKNEVISLFVFVNSLDIISVIKLYDGVFSCSY
jgi:hypothetical protein